MNCPNPIEELDTLVQDLRDLGAGLGAVGLAYDAESDELLAFCRMIRSEPRRIANELETAVQALRKERAHQDRRAGMRLVNVSTEGVAQTEGAPHGSST